MAFTNCKICGQLIKAEDDILCKECSEKMDNPYEKIKEYLYFHRGADIFKISEATGISTSLILKYMRESRITPMDK